MNPTGLHMAIDGSGYRTDKKNNVLKCNKCLKNHYDFEHAVITNKLGKKVKKLAIQIITLFQATQTASSPTN